MYGNQRINRDTKKKLVIGYRTWRKGYCTAKGTLEESKKFFRSLDDRHVEIIEGAYFSTKNPDGTIVNAECIPKNKLPDYWDDELWAFIDIGRQCEKNGYPFSLGWAEHPAYLHDIIELYAQERAMMK